jgi:8-oxo-dGTP pyrophosphatase MutT (NUDIX family)
MGRHCLYEARVQGYDAMQFNFVVSTNRRALALWQGLGFQIVGTIPRAYQHGTLGLVDAYVMHRFLDDIVPTFGAERRTATTTTRTCTYAVVPRDPHRRDEGERFVAIIRSHDNVMLPGGGLDDGEEHAAALRREVAEECALDVSVHQGLGDAIQIVGGRDHSPAIEKRSRFFSVHVRGAIERRPDHEVIWMTPDQALNHVTNDSHRWALRRWVRLNT